MAEVKISALGSAISLTGTEAVPVVQAGATKRTTTADIANLLLSAVNVVSNAVSAERINRQADVLSINNVISSLIVGAGGATANDLSIVSAQAASAISVVRTDLAVLSLAHSALSTFAHATFSVGVSAQALSAKNAASAQAASAISVVKTDLAALSVAHSALSTFAHAAFTVGVSAQAASAINVVRVSVNALSAQFVAASAMSIGVPSTGLQAALNALSNSISAVVVGAGGATIIQLDAASAQAASAINAASAQAASAINVVRLSLNALSLTVSANTTSIAATSAKLDATSLALKENISTVSVRLDVEIARAISVETAISNILSAAAVNTFSALSTINAAIISVDQRVSVLSTNYTSLMNRVSQNSAVGGGPITSDYISQQVSALNLVSARTNADVLVSIGATVGRGLQNAVDALSWRISAVKVLVGGGAATLNDISVASALAAAARSVMQVSLNALSLTVSAHTTSINANSARLDTISANVTSADTHANTASVAATSADTHANQASAAATSIGNLLATFSLAFSVMQAQVSNALSAGDVISNTISVISAGIGVPQLRRTANINTISATALTKISGMSIVVSLNGVYQINAVIIHGHSAQAAGAKFGFGVSSPAATAAAGTWQGFVSVQNAGATMNTGYFNQAGFNSITYSATPSASATMYRTELNLLLCSVAAGTVQLKARTSAGTVGAIDIQAGSYIQAFKIG